MQGIKNIFLIFLSLSHDITISQCHQLCYSFPPCNNTINYNYFLCKIASFEVPIQKEQIGFCFKTMVEDLHCQNMNSPHIQSDYYYLLEWNRSALKCIQRNKDWILIWILRQIKVGCNIIIGQGQRRVMLSFCSSSSASDKIWNNHLTSNLVS